MSSYVFKVTAENSTGLWAHYHVLAPTTQVAIAKARTLLKREHTPRSVKVSHVQRLAQIDG